MGFGPDHLPYGVFSPSGGAPRVGARVGDDVIDLYVTTGWAELGASSLNPLMALGPQRWADVREAAARVAVDRSAAGEGLAAGNAAGTPATWPLDEVTLHRPFVVGDAVGFRAAEPSPRSQHPVGHHLRAQTVVPSGTPVVRPVGPVQPSPADGGCPRLGPSRRLDLQAELGFVVGVGSRIGDRLGVDDAEAHLFGLVGLNDWAARDLQGWDPAAPDPTLASSFATSISRWVTPMAALGAAWTDLPVRSPAPPAYLRHADGRTPRTLDVELEVSIDGEVVGRVPYAAASWAPAQLLAHLTVNGASVATGDLLASGPVSGARPDQLGSLLEIGAAGGRGFLRDDELVVLRGSAPGVGGGRISLGEVAGRVAAARWAPEARAVSPAPTRQVRTTVR